MAAKLCFLVSLAIWVLAEGSPLAPGCAEVELREEIRQRRKSNAKVSLQNAVFRLPGQLWFR